jgi:hypothetical protein
VAGDAALQALAAPGPYHPHADKLMLFGRLIGSWEIESTTFAEDGTVKLRRQGEWHFAWVLGGLAVQDVIFEKGTSPHEYGTTLRAYDPDGETWHVTFVAPASDEFVVLTAREGPHGIVQEGRGKQRERLLRWSFSDIAADSFVWRGEISVDEGETWWLSHEMRATRQTSPDLGP